MKKIVRLTESDLHRIVKESVNKILMEVENKYSHLRTGHYNDGGYFDNAAYKYDDALDADTLEDYDERMKKRQNYLDDASNNAEKFHPQTEPFKKYGNSISYGGVHYVYDGANDALTKYDYGKLIR